MYLPSLLALSIPVLGLVLSEGLGVWPACVSSHTFSNVAPGSLLVGDPTSFFSVRWEICDLGSVLLLFILA